MLAKPVSDPTDPFDAALRRMLSDLDRSGRLAPFEDYARSVVPVRHAELRAEYDAIAGCAGTASFLAQGSAERAPLRVLADRFEIRGELGRGGMGIVYLAFDRKLDREVVLKTPYAEHHRHEYRRRLEREAKVLSKLEKSGICPIFDLVEQEDTLYVVLPFLVGSTLREHLDATRKSRASGSRTRFVGLDSAPTGAAPSSGSSVSAASERTPRRLDGVLELMVRIARSLHAAHEAGIVHRDLKPDNVMVKPDREPIILDFGLAVDASTHSRLSGERAKEGTPYYMAPEQITGAAEQIDRRTDVYALGVILYEALTLARPFDSSSLGVLRELIATGKPRRPRKLEHAIPVDLEAVCCKAMAVDPRRRYATALDLAEDLERVRTLEPTRARPLTLLGRTMRRVRRHPVAAAALLAACVLAALAIGIWTTLRSAQGPARAFQRYSADIEAHRAPHEHDVMELSVVVSDPEEREHFLRNPADPAIYEAMAKLVVVHTATRGGDGGGDQRLQEPRETITDSQPTIRFEGPDAGSESWSLQLAIWTGDERVHEARIQYTGPPRLVEVELPPKVLQTGRTYTWSVLRLDEPDPAHPLYAPDPARFRTAERAARDAILARITPTGVASFDVLVRANALLVRGFVADARAELGQVTDFAARYEEHLAMSLCAEIALRLGDRATFERLRDEALRFGEKR